MANFFRRGTSKVAFLPAVAGYSAGAGSPTRPEIAAGTLLTAQVTEMTGFQLSNSPIPTPNLGDRFTFQIEGEDTVADSVLTFLDDAASSTIRTALAKGTAGFILLLPYGDVATKRCEVWPVKSTGVNDEWTVGNDPARFAVGFAITNVPSQSGVVPAP